MSGIRHRVRVQHHGQITLPAALRRRLGLKPGDLVDIEESGAGVIVTPEHRTADSFSAPTPEELARRHAAAEEIRAIRERSLPLAPLTAADLVHLGRKRLGGLNEPDDE